MMHGNTKVKHFNTLFAEVTEGHPQKNHNCPNLLEGYGVLVGWQNV